MGLRKGDILNYIIQLGCQVVDFSYLSASDGKTAACYALLSSTSELHMISNEQSSHYIEQKKFTIRRIDDKEKRKYLKWRDNLIAKK